MRRIICLVLCALTLAGCAPSISDAMKGIAASGASSGSGCIYITSVYGTARLAWTQNLEGNVSCTTDGLVVRPPSPGLPVMLQGPTAPILQVTPHGIITLPGAKP